MSKVQCPVCNAEVVEADINLHLDLQCRGPAGPLSSAISSVPRSTQATPAGPSTQHKSSPAIEGSAQRVQRVPASTPAREILVIEDDTPPRPTAPARGPPKNVASIFNAKAKRKRPSDEAEAEEKPKEGVGVKRASTQGEGEKKPRVNPLIAAQPLAERSRPSTLEGYVGQADIVGPGSLLRARIEAGEGVGSCILWGPPGCGKTTLARLIAKTADADFKELSATSSGAADVRQVFEQARNGLKLTGRKTILMVDEIHRFNKTQQDLFLPYVENGWVQLIGATTENPSFKVNGALLSRCQVFTLHKHDPSSLIQILTNSLSSLSTPPPRLPPDLLPFLADVADGDARQALGGLELALKVYAAPIQATLGTAGEVEDDQAKRDEQLMDAVRKGLRKGYDRSGEERYDMISALHKCLRGSDGSAAMYWLARMITGGEDALYIARRLVVVASEDVGLADPQALPLAMATYQACQVIGLPECRINLAHCVAYLAEASKSTRAYTAYNRAEALANKPPLPGVPLQIRNAPTKLLKQLGYGKEYSYNPAFAHPVHNVCRPPSSFLCPFASRPSCVIIDGETVADQKEYLPPELLEHSSFAPNADKHILKTPDAELKGKEWDEKRLGEWEREVNGGAAWNGPFEPEL